MAALTNVRPLPFAAAVRRPTPMPVESALLRVGAWTPEPMRPGWSDALRMSRSVLPHRRLTQIDQRLQDAAARPVIVPETIVCDHGKAYLSQAFRNACRAMGITLQPSHEDSPWGKGTPRIRPGAAGRRRLNRTAAGGLAGDPRLRREDPPPHLRRQGTQPLPSPAFRGERAQRAVGGPLRPSRRHPSLGPQPPRRRLD